MERIDLNNVLPAVFAGTDRGAASQVWQCHMSFVRGQHYVVSAASGAGKSSLCAYLYGYRTDYSGSITYDGADIAGMSIAQWCDVRRRRIAYLAQDMRLFDELTAWDNVMLKNRLTGHKDSADVSRWFDLMGIADKRDTLVARLSIGQQQRVAIMRTLCQPADFFLLDEPVSHLDSDNNRIVAGLILEEATRQGAAIIATSVGNHLMIDGATMLRL